MRAFKMNGTGNSFLLIDAREADAGITPELLTAWSQIHDFDQLLKLEPSDRGDARYRIWNRDGGEVGACGNGARCAGWYLTQLSGEQSAMLDTPNGVTEVIDVGQFRMCVDLGEAHTDWQFIPLARQMDTVDLDYSLELDGYRIRRPGAVSMGNPHAVFFVDSLDGFPAERFGPLIENDPLFPERVNAGFAEILARDHIRLRVWERGAGLTKACGTGAAAAIVAGHRKGWLDRRCKVTVDGGELLVEWEKTNHVWIEGPVEFEGEVELDL